MIRIVERKAKEKNLNNVVPILRDFMSEGSGLEDLSVDYVLLFNILHAEDPVGLLSEAFRVLETGGLLGIMHWNHDPGTPRGPSMDIRPKPEQCARWAETAGFAILAAHLDLPPYHYGITARK